MSREPEAKSGGLSLQTLLISSLAAVAAAIVVPMFWARGSLLATAITPIIVALVSEAAEPPGQGDHAGHPARDAPQRDRRRACASEQPSGVGARGDGPEHACRRARDDPFGLRTSRKPPRARRFPLRLAVITGLLAAVIGAGVVTASELAIFGHQIGDSKRSTGLLGGTTTRPTRRRPRPTRDRDRDGDRDRDARGAPRPPTRHRDRRRPRPPRRPTAATATPHRGDRPAHRGDAPAPTATP